MVAAQIRLDADMQHISLNTLICMDFTVPQCKGYTENIKGGFGLSATWQTPLLTISLCHSWFHNKASVISRHMLPSTESTEVQNADAFETFFWTGSSSSRTKCRHSWAPDKNGAKAGPWVVSWVLCLYRGGMGMPWTTMGQLSASPVVRGNPSHGTTAACHKPEDPKKSHLANGWLYPWVTAADDSVLHPQ